MNNNVKSILRLITAAAISVSILLCSGYEILLKAVPVQNNHKINSEINSDIVLHSESSSFEAPAEHNTNSENKDSSEKAESTAASVPVKTSGKVIGGISEKFISPYTANTSCNSVYMKNSTDIKIDLKDLLSAKLPYKIQKNNEPQVLIVHTHTTEAFMLEDRDYYTDKDKSRSLDNRYNVVRLGNIITDKLNNAGIKTVHDTTVHDYPDYNGSYDRAAVTIKKNLQKYKSIKIVIDLHRDAIGGGKSNKVKPVTKINGRKAAQIMLVMGSQSGYVKNFPDWQENLKLAVRLQQNTESMYPSLARALSFMSRLYNENLTKGSMLLEIGTDSNTVSEAEYSAELFANALIKTLNTLQ